MKSPLLCTLFIITTVSYTQSNANTPQEPEKQQPTVVISHEGRERKLDYPTITAIILVKLGAACPVLAEGNLKEPGTGTCTIQGTNCRAEYTYTKATDAADNQFLKIHATFSAEDEESFENVSNTTTYLLDKQMLQQPAPRIYSDTADFGTITDKHTEVKYFRHNTPASKKFNVVYNCVTSINITKHDEAAWVKEKLQHGAGK